MKTARFLMVVALAIFASACSGIHSVDAHFGLTNTSDKSIIAVIDNVDAGPIVSPHQSAQFDAEIRMSSSSTATSPSNQQITVPVTVRSATGDFISRPVTCLAGLRVVTSITFAVYPPSTTGYVYCQSAVSYQVIWTDSVAVRLE